MTARISLHARIAMVAALSAAIALGVCAYLFSYWVSVLVSENMNDLMDSQVLMIERAVAPDGKIQPDRLHFLPDMHKAGSHWGWSVAGPGVKAGGGIGITRATLFPMGKQYQDGIYSAHAFSPKGLPLHARLKPVRRKGRTIRIMVAAPDYLIERPEGEAKRLILGSLALLALVLALAAILQLHFGLAPLRQLQRDIARIRSGDATSLPEGDLPREITPLVAEVNALIAQNVAGLGHARGHVANLAHGLKTPLTTLALRLEREQASDESRALVAQLDQRIAHHLRRARIAAVGVGDRARADLVAVANDLLFAMDQIHAAKRLTIARTIPDQCEVAIDSEDLDEMLGNLLDNACRFAMGRVSLHIGLEGGQVVVDIEDDGRGIEEADIPVALHPGTRLDESARGYGFGLPIVRELVELYGGALSLGRSTELGGLRSSLRLPRRG